ncbi:hypothetical protein HAX54_025721, partial [Datura stramonium]|nr:hypothetical protein [Datura stramonium]
LEKKHEFGLEGNEVEKEFHPFTQLYISGIDNPLTCIEVKENLEVLEEEPSSFLEKSNFSGLLER